MKKLFLLLAIASVALTSCETEPSALSLVNESQDSVVVTKKYIVDSCTKITKDTIVSIDCQGLQTKKVEWDTIKIPTKFYVEFKNISKSNTLGRQEVSQSKFNSFHSGDTTDIAHLVYEFPTLLLLN
jgi:hypothetical protein